jgi:hypothetical protein
VGQLEGREETYQDCLRGGRVSMLCDMFQWRRRGSRCGQARGLLRLVERRKGDLVVWHVLVRKAWMSVWLGNGLT